MASKNTNKLLLILDLNGVLGYVNKNTKTFNTTGIYSQGDLKATPVYQDNFQQVFKRPNLQNITYEMLLKQKKEFDIGIWSCQDRDNTQLQVKCFFGNFLTQLLFVSFTSRPGIQKDMSQQTQADVQPMQISRNLSSIYAKYPHYDETNTLVLSNFYNPIEEFQRNDLVIPEYNPLMGKTDFLDDKHLIYVFKYIRFLNSLSNTIGEDVRHKMESYPYETFVQKLTKSVRYDSYTYSRESADPQF